MNDHDRVTPKTQDLLVNRVIGLLLLRNGRNGDRVERVPSIGVGDTRAAENLIILADSIIQGEIVGSGTAAAITIAVIATIMVFAPFIWHLLSMQPVSTKTLTKLETVTTTIATPSPITVERTSFVTITKPMIITVTTPMPITVTERITKTLPTTITRTVPTTVFKTITQRIEKTITSPVLLTSTKTITVTTTSPIILTSTSYVWATITATEIVKEVQTKTITTTRTVTTTRVVPNFRLSNWEELHSTLMSDKVKEVYVLIAYHGGSTALDNNFVNLIKDLETLAKKNVTVKVLVHPRVCMGWQFPPPGAVSPDLVKLINELNKTLGFERLRAIDVFADLSFGILTLLSGPTEAEVLVVLSDGTAKLFILTDPSAPKIFVLDHVERIDDLINPGYDNSIVSDFNFVFKHGVVWNPKKLCPY